VYKFKKINFVLFISFILLSSITSAFDNSVSCVSSSNGVKYWLDFNNDGKLDATDISTGIAIVFGDVQTPANLCCIDSNKNSQIDSIDLKTLNDLVQEGTNAEVCPTCSDALRNGNELGMDCGGACATACVTCTVNSVSWVVYDEDGDKISNHQGKVYFGEETLEVEFDVQGCVASDTLDFDVFKKASSGSDTKLNLASDSTRLQLSTSSKHKKTMDLTKFEKGKKYYAKVNPESSVIEVIESDCGNGVKESRVGEECDDGNSNNADACNNQCKEVIVASGSTSGSTGSSSGSDLDDVDPVVQDYDDYAADNNLPVYDDTDYEQPSDDIPEEDYDDDIPIEDEDSSFGLIVPIIVVVLVVGGAGGLYYIKKVKNKTVKPKFSNDPFSKL